MKTLNLSETTHELDEKNTATEKEAQDFIKWMNGEIEIIDVEK